MEKKSDVELAKIIAEIDALKEEAAQVGRAPTPFSALKSRARPPVELARDVGVHRRRRLQPAHDLATRQ